MQLSGQGEVPRATYFSLLLVVLDIAASWDYTTNGASWENLGACGGQLGGIQSPIDLPGTAPAVEGIHAFFKYPPIEGPLQLYNNGYSIAMTMPRAHKAGFGLAPGKSVLSSPDSDAYRLWQVNFHAPSEHTMEGKRMPLEVQLVHQRVTGSDEVAVLVVLFADAGATSSDFLSAVIDGGLPQKPWDETSINSPQSKAPLDFAELVRGSPYFTYRGSLTVPPCSPQVRYIVRKEPALASSEQLREFSAILKATCAPNGNYRNIESMKIGDFNLGAGNVFMLGSVDIESSPEVKVEAVSEEGNTTYQMLKNAPTVNVAKQCGEVINSMTETFGRMQAGDSPELRKMKTRYNMAQLNLKAAQYSSGEAHRLVKNAQEVYDAAPGFCGCESRGKWYCDMEPLSPACVKCPANPTLCASLVTGMPAAGEESCRAYCFSQGSAGTQLATTGASKAVLYWNLVAAKRNLETTANRLQSADKDYQDAKEVALRYLITLCYEDYNKHKGQATSTQVLEYENPVKLPRGPKNNPFKNRLLSDGEDAGKGVEQGASFTKLAPNLHQADGPPNSIPIPLLKDAPSRGKEDGSAKLFQQSSVMATMKIPVPVKSLGDIETFKRQFADVLAASVGSDAKRFVVMEVNDAPVEDLMQELSLAQDSARNLEVQSANVTAQPSEKLSTPTSRGRGFLQVHSVRR